MGTQGGWGGCVEIRLEKKKNKNKKWVPKVGG
jgi:hypothetical protein